MSCLKKKVVEQSVLDLARERMAVTFDRYDRVAVSFSGGKDSTVCLNLALEEARKRGRLPLDVHFWDEEAIHPQTVEYVERVASLPEVKFRWLCWPVRHRNACSPTEPYWYPWAPEKEEVWCRPLPKRADVNPDFPRLSIPESNGFLYPADGRATAIIMGIRANESLRRYMSVTRRTYDNYISVAPNASHLLMIKPIYDWTTDDVWSAPLEFGWDYNQTYDLLTKVGVSRHMQRVCPPFGEEPLQNLYFYAICWPELWERMIHRVPGAATAGRYSRSPLYGFGDRRVLPEGVSYRDEIRKALDRWGPSERAKIEGRIKREIALHRARDGREIPDKAPGGLGLSWEFLLMVAVRGDIKGRKKVMYEGR